MCIRDRDTAIRRPQMPQQQPDLLRAELKHLGRQMLLVGALTVNAEPFEPCTHSRRMPAIAVAGADRLMQRLVR